MAKFLVTGGAGFIGSHLVEQLLKLDHTVVILDNLSHGSRDNLSFLSHYDTAQYRFIEGDIRDPDCCDHATRTIDYVLHQAALGSVPRSIEEPALYEDNNVKGTLTLLLAARDNRVKTVVQASSSSVYGNTLTLPKVESMTPRPQSPYALSKLACEHYGHLFTTLYGLPVISLRYFNVFGPRQDPHSPYAAVIPKFMTAWLNNTAPTIYSDGHQTRDFTYIDNVVQANINSCFAANGAAGHAYNIGNNHNISINVLADTIRAYLKTNTLPHYAPKRPGDVQDSLADITRAKADLNYTALTTLDEGLAVTVAWYKHRTACPS